MPDFRDLVKHLVGFGVPLNEVSSLGGALNILLIQGSDLFNSSSELTQDQLVFLVSDLVDRGADLTERINQTTITPAPRYLYCETVENHVGEIHCSSSYLYAVLRRNIHDGMSLFLCEILYSVLQLVDQLRVRTNQSRVSRISLV